MRLFTVLLLILIVVAVLPLPTSGIFWKKQQVTKRCDQGRKECKWRWSGCSQACGGGYQRPVVLKKQDKCGRCVIPIARTCNTRCCPVECNWQPWKPSGPCTASCGMGLRVLRRRIKQTGKCGKKICTGATFKIEKCNLQPCPSTD